jgi:ABC-2 type transport system ATP-binding protein
MLYGDLNEIRNQFSGHAVLVRMNGEIPSLPEVAQVSSHNRSTKLTLSENATPQDLLRALTAQNVRIEKFEIAVPTLDEIFIQVVQNGDVA